jgi:hypothetical protein
MAGWDDSMFANLPRPKIKGRVAATPDPDQPLTPAVQAARPQTYAEPGPQPSYADQLAQWLYAKGTANLPASAEPALRNTLQAGADLYNRWTPTGSFEGGVRAGMQGDAPGFVTGVLGAAPIPGAPGAKIAARGAESAAEDIATGAATRGITAYHGSPYDFDRFDISKIGTGEGAQAYGHGLYFAGNEDVAKSYRDSLAGGKWTYAGKPASETWDASALDYLDKNVADKKGMSAAIDDAVGRLKNQSSFYNDAYAGGSTAPNLYDNAIARLQRLDPERIKPAGSMYQVDINADPDRFIDWDKPMNEQHPDVQAVLGSSNETAAGQLGRAYRNPMFAGDLIGQDRATPDELSAALASKGIPGIKYLDQGSRGGGGDATHNYVTFSDDTIDILRKYGLAGLGLTAGAGALATQRPSDAEAAPSVFPPQGTTLNAQPNWSPP